MKFAPVVVKINTESYSIHLPSKGFLKEQDKIPNVPRYAACMRQPPRLPPRAFSQGERKASVSQTLHLSELAALPFLYLLTTARPTDVVPYHYLGPSVLCAY